MLRQIGDGQEARVFLARARGELFALKQLEGEGEEELELLNTIRHPGIVRLIEAI